jgi:hypothetical protein
VNNPAARIRLLRERDGGACAGCGEEIDFALPRDDRMAVSIDEIVPRAAGGKEVPENQQLMHRACNEKKGAWHDGVNYAPLVSRMIRYKHRKREKGRKAQRDARLAAIQRMTPEELRAHPDYHIISQMHMELEFRKRVMAWGGIPEEDAAGPGAHYLRLEEILIRRIESRESK